MIFNGTNIAQERAKDYKILTILIHVVRENIENTEIPKKLKE
jgi:hypothetical protein